MPATLFKLFLLWPLFLTIQGDMVAGTGTTSFVTSVRRLSNTTVGLSNTTVGLSNSTVGLSNTTDGLSNSTLGLNNITVGLSNTTVSAQAVDSPKGAPRPTSRPTTQSKARNCSVTWPTVGRTEPRLRIAIVTLSSKKSPALSNATISTGTTEENRRHKYYNKPVFEKAFNNREVYAKNMGYDLIDGSHLMNHSRPAAWSKILAVKYYLPNYDWVFWLDADILITNRQTPLESFLPTNPEKHLVVTSDVNFFNSGIWALRNCSWSMRFLQAWWDKETFVRGFDSSLSGDNDAMVHHLRNMSRPEFNRHVAVAPQCSFNSYMWQARYMDCGRMRRFANLLFNGLWHPGHFALHLAGVEDKSKVMEFFFSKTEKEFEYKWSSYSLRDMWRRCLQSGYRKGKKPSNKG